MPIDLANLPNEVELIFEVSSPVNSAPEGGQVLLTTLACDRIVVPVDVPILMRTLSIDATVVEAQPARWTEPASWQAQTQLALTIDVQSSLDLPFPTPLAFSVDVTPGTLADNRQFTVEKPGTVDLPILIDMRMPNPVTTKLVLELQETPAWGQVEPARVELSIAIAPPVKVTTTVAATAIDIGTPEWVSLMEGTAAFEADIRVHVDGVLGSYKSVLALQAPAGVRQLKLSERIIRPGDQTVRLTLVAALQAAPAINEFLFALSPSQQGAIDVQPEGPLRVVVPGPPPARLAFAQRGQVRSRLAAALIANGSRANLNVRPILVGVPDSGIGRGLFARVETGDNVRLGSQDQLPLFSTSLLEVEPTQPPHRSFLRDSVIETELSVAASTPSPAIAGTNHTLVLTSEAPFKRVLTIALSVVFALLLVYLPYRFLNRLSVPISLEKPDDPSIPHALQER